MASSSSPRRWNYDVFLSFRGEDVRKIFSDHLYMAMKEKDILVFRDENALQKGKQISSELIKGIQESRFAIIIFSENYAFSRWCLDELVNILDCTKTTGQIALPIFYNVDPSDMRHQRGSFAKAFDKHEEDLMEITEEKEYRRKERKVEKWRAALSHAANLSGWDSRDRYEGALIKEIVQHILTEKNQGPQFDDSTYTKPAALDTVLPPMRYYEALIAGIGMATSAFTRKAEAPDRASFDNPASGRVGIVIRDHDGKFIAAMADRIVYVNDGLQFQAVAAIPALKLAKPLGYQKVRIQSDCKNLSDQITQGSFVLHSHGTLIRNIVIIQEVVANGGGFCNQAPHSSIVAILL